MLTMIRGCVVAGLGIVAGACSFPSPQLVEHSVDAGLDSGPEPPLIDAPPAPPRCDFEHADLCAFTAGPDRTYAQNSTLDTTMNNTCDHVVAQGGGQPELCVIYAESITVSANVTVRAIGSRPLMFASRKGIHIYGTLNASSSRSSGGNAEILGAGAESALCTAFASVPQLGVAGGGGGAGASYSGRGGSGSTGATFGTPRSGGLSPSALSQTELSFLRGGCRGQNGGDDGDLSNAILPGNGGPGGGSLYLAASSDIVISMGGRIAVNGGGGGGGGFLAAGGGGGSGGMLLLEARSVHRMGMIVANGGGGGEGGGTAPVFGGISGSAGADGVFSASAAAGGNNDFLSGAGGDGSDATQRNGRNGGNSADGGGGGGGAAGFIRMITTGTNSGAGVISPPASN